MIELEYPQNKEAEQFQPRFKGVDEIKPGSSSSNLVQQFFGINPDSYNEQTRKDLERQEVPQGDVNLSQYAGNIAPLQDNTYSLGAPTKAWAQVRSYVYADESGDPLPFYSSITTPSGSVQAGGSRDTVNFTSGNGTIAITGTDGTPDTIDLRIDPARVQPKTALTIGYSTYNDYVCNPLNPFDAFNSLIAFIAAGGSPATVFIEDGSYLFNNTLIIPNTINITLIGNKGKCSIASTVAVTMRFGGVATPPMNTYQVMRGVYIESVTIQSSPVLTFNECRLTKLVVGTSTSDTPYLIRFTDCDIFGTINFLNAYDVGFIGGRVDGVGSPLAVIDSSSNIRFHAMSIHSVGTFGGSSVITLRDSAFVSTERIMIDDCAIENYGLTMPLLSDLRTNAASNSLKMSGMLLGVSVTPASYFNPSTNRFDFTP